jgi:NTE family protein
MPTPVSEVPPDCGKDEASRTPEDGMVLSLSGGGYRAMLFHLGSLWRLYESRLLRDVKRISSVSGGSITAATLGLRWLELSFDPARLRDDFIPYVVDPIRDLARQTIDRPSVLLGGLLPGTISEHVERAYRKHLFGTATLQELPSDEQGPRFVINATNIQSGALFRFSKPYARDYRVGEIRRPRISLAKAVAASSAFPPVLSPASLKLDSDQFVPNSGADLQFPPYTTDILLSDGGVYDNLGLETAWKRYGTVLVSDAGAKLEPEKAPARDWVRHAIRVTAVIDDQVRSLRKRQLIASYLDGSRKGAYWGIRTDIRCYDLANTLDCPLSRTEKLAAIPTRLAHLDDALQERLVNWGYAVADAALRRHLDARLPAGTFPYPERGV